MMRSALRVLSWRTCTLVGLAACIFACVDKQLLSPATAADLAVIRLSADYVAQLAPTTRTVDIRIGYDRTSGERVVLADTQVALTSETQALTVSADLRRCLDDRARAGTPASCPLRVVVTLISAAGVTLDTKDLGPFDAVPGRAPIEVSATLTTVASVVIATSSTNVPLKGTTQLAALAKNEGGNTLADRRVTWASSNAAVASVSSTGLVLGIGAGTATITAACGGTTATTTVTVGALGVGFGLDQFALISPGTFEMGSNAGDLQDRPVHTVTITRAFYMQKTEVTQWQWRAVMGTDPSAFRSCGDTCPVERVSWDDIQAFLQKLNASMPGQTYRLSTEAEWEYAARAGTTAETYGPLDAIAWYSATANSRTHPVAGKQANAWGLYDMIGNVWEWANDWYGAYSSAPATDPSGPTSGTYRAMRGASWFEVAMFWQRAAVRDSSNSEPFQRASTVGFRLASTASSSVAAVVVAPSSASIGVGQTATFTASERDPGGNTLSGRTFVWSSVQPTIATVTQSGVATGVAAGTATITATADGITGTATLTVNATPVASVTVSPIPASMVVNAEMAFTATTRDAQGNTLTGRDVTWATSNPSVATIGMSTGRAIGVAVGTATITATSEGKEGIATLTVTTGGGLTCTGAPQLGCGFALDQFALIQPGTFQMGSSAYSGSNEQPVHTVTITRPFYMQKTEVTQGQWRAVMGTNPAWFSSCGDTCPVEMVSWDDIQTFLQKMNASTQGVTYRLPTEAEWEYAARAGTTAETYGPLDAIAWYGPNAGLATHPVAGRQANAWGLYDMIGNVWEWVNDLYGAYSSGSATDPSGPTSSGGWGVMRGASSRSGAGSARAAARSYLGLSGRNSDVGFRLVRIP